MPMKALIVKEVKKRLMEEGVTRIEKCLNELTIEEVWFRPNQNSNSVGNLVLHLCGNVRQWLVSGLGGREDTRNRPAEFNENGPIESQALLNRLDEVMQEVNLVLHELKEEDLTRPIVVQGFEETGLSVLIHVIEHFSYHVGQITYYVKWRKDIDTAYYGGLELNNFGQQKTTLD